MAVTIPSDLIADVMRIADPARLRAVSQKLGDLQDGPAVSASGFSGTLDRLNWPVKASAGPAVSDAGASGEAGGAYRSFEQMMLRNVFESILPQADSGIYGGDVSAGIWRSMAADQLASAYSDAGGAGIAQMLSKKPAPVTHEQVVLHDQWPYFMASEIRSFAG